MESDNLPPVPIILNPALADTTNQKAKEKRGFLGTFGLLLSGWLLGNLILFAILGLVGITVIGSTGLVRIPVVSKMLFGQPHPQAAQIDGFAFENAQEKITTIKNLKAGQTLKELDLYQNELNALLIKSIETAGDFPLTNPNLEIDSGGFVFSGLFKSTNAPVTIKGTFTVNDLTAKVNIIEAKFGKISMPLFLASSIIDSNLAKIGLTLSGGEIPAQEVDLSPGLVTLKKVAKPSR